MFSHSSTGTEIERLNSGCPRMRTMHCGRAALASVLQARTLAKLSHVPRAVQHLS